jgi:hypothetical protein
MNRQIPSKESESSVQAFVRPRVSYHFLYSEDEPHRGRGVSSVAFTSIAAGTSRFRDQMPSTMLFGWFFSAIPGEAIRLADENIEGFSAL